MHQNCCQTAPTALSYLQLTPGKQRGAAAACSETGQCQAGTQVPLSYLTEGMRQEGLRALHSSAERSEQQLSQQHQNMPCKAQKTHQPNPATLPLSLSHSEPTLQR